MKKGLIFFVSILLFLNGADGGGRTRMPVRATDFESVTSANSITSARANTIITQKMQKSIVNFATRAKNASSIYKIT